MMKTKEKLLCLYSILFAVLLMLLPVGTVHADGQWVTYDLSDMLSEMMESHVTTIYIDIVGNVWIGSMYSGIFRFDGDTWTNYTTDDGLAGNTILSIAEDNNGTIWAGGYIAFGYDPGQKKYIGGVSRFEGETWTAFHEDDGLASDAVKCIAVDNDGTLWAGAEHYVWTNKKYFRGISRFDGETWMTYDETDGLINNAVNTIAVESGGEAWIGTREGVSRFDGFSWQDITTDDGLIDNYVRTIVIDQEETVWFGTPRGLSSYYGETWTSYTTADGLVHDSIHDMCVDSENTLWCVTYEGLNAFRNAEWHSISVEDSLFHVRYSAIASSQNGEVWVGYNYYDEQQGKVEYRLARYTPEQQTAVVKSIPQPVEFAVTGNNPNPFNPETLIHFTLPNDSHIDLSIYNVEGQHVRTITAADFSQGMHTVLWDGRDDKGALVSSGIYFSHLRSGSTVSSHRMLLVK